ncbi:MAG: cupin domain-containing protein [Nocardioidaceae bacterium]
MTDTLALSPAQTLRIITSTPHALEVESTWAAGPGQPPRAHFHPRQHERFEVLAGALTVQLDQEPPRMLRPGDTLEVPPRVVHRMWNAGPEPTLASWRISPRMRTEEMFQFIDHGLSPRRIATLLWTFRCEFRLSLRR